MLFSGISMSVVTPPAAAARLVDVHVRVHEPRHQQRVARVDDLRALRRVVVAADRADHAARDGHGRRAHALRQHDAPAAEDPIGRGRHREMDDGWRRRASRGVG
jgi:hypothetical protein